MPSMSRARSASLSCSGIVPSANPVRHGRGGGGCVVDGVVVVVLGGGAAVSCGVVNVVGEAFLSLCPHDANSATASTATTTPPERIEAVWQPRATPQNAPP